MDARAMNRLRQGDLGEASAVDWFTRLGAVVFTPIGHSSDVDLIALLDHHALRVQVKTSTQVASTSTGDVRFSVTLATSGGNRSWGGKVKTIDPSTIDFLFVLTGGGRRWCIPVGALDATNAVTLGGPKYADYEIQPVEPIARLVYTDGASLDCLPRLGEYPSGQRTATVNRQAQPSQVRILPPPSSKARFRRSTYERKPGQHGEAVINQKRRVTLPQAAVIAADLRNGDRIRATAEGYGRIVIERIELPVPAQPELPAA
jgi:PD-(D/E)XK nuclease superfamily protein